MKTQNKTKWSQIKLTTEGRSKLRTAIREHPDAAKYVRSGTEISGLNKASLLNLAEKLEIDYGAILNSPTGEYSWLGSVNAQTGMFAPDPFSGVIEFPFTMGLLDLTVTRQARIRYTHTPVWVYFDPNTCHEVVPSGDGGSFVFEVQSIAETEIYYTGDDRARRGRAIRRKLETDWEPCNDMTEIGIWTDEMWDAINNIIDKDCRRQDEENRKHAMK